MSRLDTNGPLRGWAPFQQRLFRNEPGYEQTTLQEPRDLCKATPGMVAMRQNRRQLVCADWDRLARAVPPACVQVSGVCHLISLCEFYVISYPYVIPGACMLILTRMAVTIDKGADSKLKELEAWKASSRNLKHLDQN
jgi:hypothetical protein